MEIEECLERVLAKIQPAKENETAALDKACGRILSEDVIAKRNVPEFPRSAMDGYAVHSADVANASQDAPVRLKVSGKLYAGDVPEDKADYGTGTAVRIMTGACVPEAYDAVIMQEQTDYGEEQVEIYSRIKAYQNYCKIGEDIAAGTVLAKAGVRIRASHIALFASLGIKEVPVVKPARIAILSTGSELMDLQDAPVPGKIYNSISYMLQDAIRQQGLQVVRRSICPDEGDALREQLRDALAQADLVITTGGVSVGQKDIVPKVLEEMGAEILFHGADIQPGTPTMGAFLDGKIVLALSGNPYAAMANFELYFWPVMAKRMRSDSFLPVMKTAKMKSEYNKINKHRRLIRAFYEDGEVRLPTGVHASSVISNLTECNCFIDLEAGRAVQIGDTVRVRMFYSF